VLNRVARSVIERLRGLHAVHVFVHAREKHGDPRPVTKINKSLHGAGPASCVALFYKGSRVFTRVRRETGKE
jgi:hypothetical protein